MRHGSLFSGIGGIDLGFERAGIETVWQCELDEACRELLGEKFGVPIYRDVSDWKGWIDEADEIDVLSGGSPCQDISLAGPEGRPGLNGARSGLWYRFADIIARVRPEWVLIENVAGLLHSNGGRDLGTILGTLEDLGYEWAYRVLDARYFGVPQRRRRIFVVGHRGTRDGGPARVLDLASGSGELDRPGFEVRRASRAPVGGVAEDATVTLRMRAGRPGGGKGPLISEESALTIGTWQDQVVFTPGQPPRKFTGRELERLFGFPDDWTEGFPLKTRERMLGNAVVVPVAEWIGRRLIGA